MLFFFKKKTAYEMRISDWSSDVCSSDRRDQFGAAIDQRAIQFGKAQVIADGKAEPAERGFDDFDRAASRIGGGLGPILPRGQGNVEHVDQLGRASCRDRVCPYV